ncbi:23S rRNA (pseudouridine(1915)-N(3))-methyltransferase RlmH [Niabella beijingensis]|uniref:23S rRNA (pseudouridine(1915)-N(3))-methyltransferase RlmH n=1 Tax=Niabella beijingensis TaxID=2872700 RepID=UPI001CC0095A|nr:23S rRNA (pseudouridine(1915)-N(3))-methyltransferase RlmH [Niabella beijingensis]MBZ4190980.1 23S rRNA (pseudouridine(1915)-N(3))-methyltransferase RlmH [Niabella beijingensis]
MKIVFWALGKQHDTYVKEGVEGFSGRIENYFKLEWELIPVPKEAAHLSAQEQKKKEATVILPKIAKEDYLVALDEGGRQMTSEGLAGFLQSRANAGTRRIIFLIGGAYGLDETVQRRANTLWSLSQLVFPHQLVRLILAEQVYRACTIIRNEKYHHS